MIAILFAACDSNKTFDLTKQETEVYLTLLKNSKSKEIVVDSQLFRELGIEDYEQLNIIIEEASTETSKDFFLKNAGKWSFETDTDTKGGYVLIGSLGREERLSQLSSYNLVSRVGFNSKEDEAIVFYYYVCKALCSHGGFYLLNRIEGKWVVVAQSELIRS